LGFVTAFVSNAVVVVVVVAVVTVSVADEKCSDV